MARFARPTPKAAPTVVAPVRTTGATFVNHQGGTGFERTAKSELALLAMSYMGKDSFYEKDRDPRLRELFRFGAVQDQLWTYNFIGWLRNGAGLRTAAIIGAVEFVKARLNCENLGEYISFYPAPQLGISRAVVSAACQRADEPAEIFACWEAYGYGAFPKALKRGVADAATRLYNEKSAIKWDSEKATYRFADVIEICHPKPEDDTQSALFAYLLDNRHHGEDVENSMSLGKFVTRMARPVMRREFLKTLPSYRFMFRMDKGVREQLMRRNDIDQHLKEAGMTWENLSSWLGRKLKAEDWSAILPSMGLSAVIRNARNMDQAQVSLQDLKPAFERLEDAEQVKRARLMPFRYLSAYRHAGIRWHGPLHEGLRLSLSGVPSLDGRTLILVDRSNSMYWHHSEKTELTFADTAALFGSALALRAESANLVQFGSNSQGVAFDRIESPLQLVERFGNMGGTRTGHAIQANYAGHDRVIILTDEQAQDDCPDPTAFVPAHVPVFTWNLVGYKLGQAPVKDNRYVAAGLTDQGFSMIPILENGDQGKWPWQ
jgi:hypothetical protein